MENADIRTERFLNGELHGSELEAFLAQLETDENLRRYVALQRQGRAALEGYPEHEEAAFKRVLESVGDGYFPEEGNTDVASGRIVFLRRLVAAAIVIGVLFVGLRWYAASYWSAEKLLVKHYSPVPTPSTLAENTYQLRESFSAYQNQQYLTAIEGFGAVPPDSRLYPEALLFTGYAHYEFGQYDVAARAFKLLMDLNDIRFQENAEWHLALSLLASDPDSDEAKALLTSISEQESHAFNQAAVALRSQWGHPLRRISE